MKCSICKKVKHEDCFPLGVKVEYATFIDDDLNTDKITFPQPKCLECIEAFNEWLRIRNIFIPEKGSEVRRFLLDNRSIWTIEEWEIIRMKWFKLEEKAGLREE